MGSGEKSETFLFNIHNTTAKRINTVLKIVIEFMFAQTAQPYTKSCRHQSNSFVVVTIKKTSWGGSKKFEDIAFENTQTFSVPNGKIQLVAFNDCRWEESVFEKVMFSFSQGNTINISGSIRKCKKPSIFENFLVVESFFWSNYRLIVQSSDYILK